MNRKRQYLKLFLFVFVLILPSVLVAGLGWKNIGYARHDQKVAADKIAADAHESRFMEIDRLVWNLLEKIKSQVIDKGESSNTALKFAAWVDEERIAMPWEEDLNARRYVQTINDTAFLAGKEEAERAEYERSLDRAIPLYRGLIQSAGSEGQRAYARLRLAVVLSGSGAAADADGEFRKLLALPSSVVNEKGLSFASVAAWSLVATAPREVLGYITREMESPAALTLDQSIRFGDILNLMLDSGGAGLRADAKTALEKVSDRIAKLEQMKKDLEKDADLLALRKNLPKGLSESAWQPFGADLLISRAPAGAAMRPMVIAVRRANILGEVSASRGLGEVIQIAVGEDSPKPLDGQRIPGLTVEGPLAGFGTPPTSDLHPTFFAGLLLVVSLNLFGGYLLWRDTRRETRLSELRSQFVSSVSHELKTPLTSIRMFAEILQMGSASDAHTRDECLNTIVNESERLTRLLNNVLDFSRIEHGQKTYQMASTQLSDVVKDAAKTMQYPLAEQGFALHMNVDEQIPAVNADRDALKQAVLNLLTNAMKYSGASRNIELRLFPQNGDAMIQVRDHGIGISEREQSRIFERYHRAQVAENLSISGTGLGLALVAHIAEAHGGKVQVESTPGEGSTFSICLPAHAGGVS